MTAPTTTVSELAASAATEALATARDLGHPVLASVAIPTEAPVALPRGETAATWSQPGLEASGSGVAAEVSASGNDRFAQLRERVAGVFAGAVSRGHEPLAFTGGAFADAPRTEGWEPFPAATAWVPRVTVVEDTTGRWIVSTTTVAADEHDAAVAERLEAALRGGIDPASAEEPHASTQGTIAPDDETFGRVVEAALAEIARGSLTKVVLARRLRTRTTTSPASLAVALGARYPQSYRYAWVRDGSAFLGASPELLVETDGGTVHAAPAAGTVAGTPSFSANRKLAGGLDTVKSRWEQELVVDTVYDALEPLCSSIRASLPQVVPAGPVQHLSTDVTGLLARPTHVLDLVAALHPTPAVAGLPREDAVAFLREGEGFDRGWYAGPIGVVHPDGSGAFAVALRCALMHDGLLDLFAGAGIVDGSIPHEERQEVEMKLRVVASALTPE